MAIGIIAEYNPFHNGHKYMLQELKEKLPEEPIVIGLSGSISQRGEMTLLDKWSRARLAVLGGANLVIELPAVFACRSAQGFGLGGIRLLSATGVVDRLAFGTEYPDIDQLQKAASFVPDSYPQELQNLLAQGHSYGSAITHLMAQKLHLPEAMLYEPNTILALEYLRGIHTLRQQGLPAPTPLAIRRQGTSHGSTQPQGEFASGTTLRQLAIHTPEKEKLQQAIRPLVPTAVAEAISQCPHYPTSDQLYPLLRYRLATSSPQELRQIVGMGEGLEQAMAQAINAPSYEAYIRQLTSRRYPSTRIQRLVIHLLLNMHRDTIAAMDQQGPLYLRVLAMDATGRQILRQIKSRGTLPLLTKVSTLLNHRQLQHPEAHTLAQRMLALDIAATNLRSLAMNTPAGLYEDYLHSPCYCDVNQ